MERGSMTAHGTVRYAAEPGGRHYLRRQVAPLVLGLPLAIGYGAWKMREDPVGGAFTIVLTVVVVGGIVGLTRLRQRSLGVAFTESHILLARRGGFRAIPRDEVPEAVLADSLAMAGGDGPHLFLLNGLGRRVHHIDAVHFSPEQVREVARRLPRTHHLTRLTRQEAQRRWPSMLPWTWLHPWSVAAIVLLGVAGALLTGVVVVHELSG